MYTYPNGINRQKEMKTNNEINGQVPWTGIADFIDAEMPPNAIGIVARVVTFAANAKSFEEKVRKLQDEAGGELTYIEEAVLVTHFLRNEAFPESEIFEMLEQAKKHPDDVIFGEYHYYTLDDA